ncbi:MAG: EAL domain-containing protein [Clostridiaceae bacterium]|nr:EAL domain-containing protein [Clostridiaceae bacterium]
MKDKILVLNDNPQEQNIIKNVLGEYEILVAQSYDKALEFLKKYSNIMLVFVDISSRHLNGFKLLSDMYQYPGPQSIILAETTDIENVKEGMKLGALSYMFRPLDGDALKSVMEVHIEKIDEYGFKIFNPRRAFDAVFDTAPIGIAMTLGKCPFVDINYKFLRTNSKFEQITGRKKEELLSLGWKDIITPEDFDEEVENCLKIHSGNCTIEKRIRKTDGSLAWVKMFVVSISNVFSSIPSHICFVHDITAEKMIEYNLIESERSKEVLLTHLPGLAFRCLNDENWTMLFVSNGSYELTGYYPESLLNNRDLSYNDLIAPEYRDRLRNEWDRCIKNHETFKHEYEIITAKGERKWVIEMGQPIYNDQGEPEALEGIVLDITDRKSVELNLRYYFEHDRWTHLKNRNVLEKHLYEDYMKGETVKRAVVGVNLGAMYFITLSHGFHYTQEYVRNIARALESLCTDNITLYNTYEYRFVFYIKGYKDKDEIALFCEKIKSTLDSVLGVERIGGGIGVVEIDKDNEYNVDLILRNLLIASERTVNGKPTEFEYCFFDVEMEVQMNREKDIQNDLNKIATTNRNDDNLFLLYQPIIDLSSNKIYGFEALSRLNTKKYGVVPPLEFINIAEKTRLIIPIGVKIIRKAFGFLKKLENMGYGNVNISINISAIQLIYSDFAQVVMNIIDEMEISPDNITFEITESVYVANYDKVNEIIGQLRLIGIHIAIDDFGKGYSSLAAELGLQANCLKIDKFFIDSIMTTDPDKAITSDIISMAHKLGHYVIAEGVEHEEQKKYLVNCGCEKVQGFLFSKPVSEEEAVRLLIEMGTD